jgi:hypothetical protein
MTTQTNLLRYLLAALLFCAVAFATDTLTMKDGAQHTGVFVGATARTITFKEGRTIHHYPRTTVRSLEFGTPASTASPSASSGGARAATSAKSAAAAPSRAVVLPAGTELEVLANENIDSSTAKEGQTFRADVAENVMNSSGQVVIPKGSEAELVIRKVSTGGVTGTPEVTLDLQSIKVGGRRYTVNTEDLAQKGSDGIGANKRTAEMVGGGAVLGTLIGAIAGHGKGAAIGAAAGAAAGAGTQILTRGKTVKVPAETKLRFKLDQPLRLEAAY